MSASLLSTWVAIVILMRITMMIKMLTMTSGANQCLDFGQSNGLIGKRQPLTAAPVEIEYIINIILFLSSLYYHYTINSIIIVTTKKAYFFVKKKYFFCKKWIFCKKKVLFF